MRIGLTLDFWRGTIKGLRSLHPNVVASSVELKIEHEYVVFVPEELANRWPYQHKHVSIVPAPYSWYSVAEQIFMPLLIKRQRIDLMHFPLNVPILYRGPFVVTIHDLISSFSTERHYLGPMMYQFKQFAYHRVVRHAALAASISLRSRNIQADLMDYFHYRVIASV